MSSAGHPKPLVSVLTPSIPPREQMLAECVASVQAQTERGYEHLTWVDEERKGCAWTMNRLAERARGEWLLPLADDDLLLPGALRLLLAHAGEGEVIWSRPLVWGNASPHLTQGNPPYIPSFALIRAELWHSLGGYEEHRRREEDRNLWIAALNAGARFVLVEDGPTWIYRFHDGNKSYHGGVAS